MKDADKFTEKLDNKRTQMCPAATTSWRQHSGNLQRFWKAISLNLLQNTVSGSNFPLAQDLIFNKEM